MLEHAKTFGAVGLERLHFAGEKDMNLGSQQGSVMHCMFVPPPPNSYFEALTPSVMVLGGGPFRK